jgi:hypothetical protein
MKITVYTDPGHGWGAVKRTVLADLGIANRVTAYSYQRGQSVYLEEDCDLSLLIGALRERGITPVFTERHTDRRSPIRSYDSYRPALF